jgi:hypothetical protein
MRIRIRSISLLLALSTVIAAPAAAQVVVHGNGAPNSQAGWDIFNDYRAADDFAVTTTLAFDLIRFWGLLPSGVAYTPTMFWEVLTDAGGVPSTTSVASGSAVASAFLRTSLGVGFDSWQFDLGVGPQLLGPGIFWLALHDGQPGDVTDSSLLWEMTNARHGSEFAVDFMPVNEWSGSFGGDLAFELVDSAPVTATPEPATLTLVASGLIAVAAAKRRRRRAMLAA